MKQDLNTLPLSDWIGEVAKLAGYDNGAELVVETGTCCWLGYWEDGYSPKEAWAEECSE